MKQKLCTLVCSGTMPVNRITIEARVDEDVAPAFEIARCMDDK